jgi:hypothetical protein
VAVTKVYQDLFKRSPIDNKLTCMQRIPKFKFEHSLYMPNLDLIGLPGQVSPEKLATRLTNRALYFHGIMQQFSGQNQSSIPVGLSIVPTKACIGPRSNDRSRPKNL